MKLGKTSLQNEIKRGAKQGLKGSLIFIRKVVCSGRLRTIECDGGNKAWGTDINFCKTVRTAHRKAWGKYS